MDCFNTIIYRKKKRNDIFKQWTKALSEKYNITWKYIYKTYKSVNFNLCFKKLFLSLTLQESFDIVLNTMFIKLAKKFAYLAKSDFIESAKNIYIETELNNFSVNKKMITLLEQEKNKGKPIYLVSDFYCTSDVITFWFEKLNIAHLFTGIFSSCDFFKEKATTKLYKYLIKKLNLNARNVKMYGDNLWSDILMAKTCGLATQRVKKTKEKNEPK